MKTFQLRNIGRWLAISLISTMALTSAPLSNAATAPIEETNVNQEDGSQTDVKAMVAEAHRLQFRGNYTAAAAIWRHLLSLSENNLGKDHPATAISLNNLAEILRSQGQYAEAEKLYHRSLRILEKALGPDHPNVATSLNNIALLLQSQGQHDAAEHLYRRSLSIREKSLGPDHPDVAASLNNIAILLQSRGDYAAAKSLLVRSLGINEKALGPDDSNVATSLNNLAELLRHQGKYTEAEPLYRRALSIREKALGPAHPDVGISINNLGQLLQSQGQYAEAEVLYRRSLGIIEKALGPEHPNVATSLNQLAGALLSRGKYAAAEPLFRHSQRIYERVFDPNHPYVAIGLNNLAFLLKKQGQYAAAKPLLDRALGINERTLGRNHPNVATSLENLAEILQLQGQYAGAESLYRRALDIRRRALGPEHPDTAMSLNKLANIFTILGEYASAVTAHKKSLAIESSWLIRELPLLPERARAAQLRQQGYAWEATFSLIDHHPNAVQLALETRLNRKGLLPEIEQHQGLLLNASRVSREKVEQLQALTKQLASISLPASRRSAISNQRDRLQSELYRQFPDLQIQTVTPTSVAQALPADGVLVEFQRFQPFDGRQAEDKRWGQPQYIALLLKPNGSISAVPLGPAAAIDAMVHKGLRSSAEGLSDAEAVWVQLSKQVLRPLLPHLSGSRQWFFSPDGELNRVPFAALPAPQQPNLPLAQAVQLRLLTTGRELVRLKQQASAASAAVVMANPSYDRHSGMAVAATQSDVAATLAQRRSADLSSNRWLPLPGTEREGQQVASLLGTHLISGSGATTTALQQQQGPRVLHIATHGFFVADQESSPADPLQTIQEQAPQLRAFRGEEPLLRSGLVLAGANQPNLDPKDDGYLTAAEALMLKLKGTELVVLSACSTAQGDIRTGEGVYGLQRALTVAGARSTLLSLWKVDDAATAEFMTRFYRRLKAGEGRADALAAVQQEFRDGMTGNDTWRSPTYWAAWQLVGDWRPIQGL